MNNIGNSDSNKIVTNNGTNVMNIENNPNEEEINIVNEGNGNEKIEFKNNGQEEELQNNGSNVETLEGNISEENNGSNIETLEGNISEENNGSNIETLEGNVNENNGSNVETLKENVSEENDIFGNELNNVNYNTLNETNEIKDIIVVEEDVYVEETERTYQNDLVYLKELENEILATYPVSKQGLLYIQEEVANKAKELVDAKNDGLKRYEEYENGFDYPTIIDMYNNVYSNNWLIPVILDKHKIYSIIQEDESKMESKDGNNNINSEKYITQSLEDEAGIIKDSQVRQHELLWNVKHDSILGRIDYKSYLRTIYKIQSSYTSNPKSEENQVGYFTKLQNDALVLRYNDIDSVQWNSRKIRNDILSYKDSYNEETGRVNGIVPYSLIRGEDVQIVGFMLLNKVNDYDNHQLYSNDNVSNHEPLVKKLILSSKITKITQVGDFIKIVAPNHGLNAKSRIYIDNSNCVPNINGMKQHINITIENENEFSIKSSTKLNIDGTYGEIYTPNKLVYDRYKIVYNEQIDEFQTNYENSTYQEKEESNNHNKLYLFDDLILKSKDEFRKILTKIVPTLDYIIENESERLAQCYTIQDVEYVLERYNLKINNLKIDQFDFIKNILKSNLEKLHLQEELLKRESLTIFHITNKERFSDKNFFLADLYITNENVTKYYKQYPHLNKPEDCVSARLIWLMDQRDHGVIFFSEMMKMFYGIFKEQHDINMINNMIETYGSQSKNGEKQLNKEIMIENQLRKGKNNKNKKSCCQLYRYQYSSLKDLEKEANNENINDGTLALVDKEIYSFDKNAESWTLTEIVPKYDKIEYLCTFNNTDLEELDIDTLDAVYRKDYGCHSRLYTRFKDRLTYVSQVHQDFLNLKSYIESDSYMDYFENQIAQSVQKYYVESGVQEKEEIVEEEKLEIIKHDALDILIRKIYGLRDIDMQENYIYNLIEKDGLLIGMDLYSKKYKRKIDNQYICGHHVYKMRERKANDPKKKEQIVQNMFNLFGDEGEASSDVQTCRNCGKVLGTHKSDDVEGYTEAGQQIRSRDVWVEDEEDKAPQTVADLETYDPKMKYIDCDSKEFRKIFLEKDFKPDDIQHAKDICTFVQKNMCSKTGILLNEYDTISIIIDSLEKIRNIPNFKDYTQREAKLLMSAKGFKPEMIKRMLEEGIFLKNYEVYQRIQYASIISSRFLISVQTAVPDYQFSTKLSPCAFTSFDGIDGIQYISCLLLEMGTLPTTGNKDEMMKSYMNYVDTNYNEFKKSTAINQLYMKKREYKMELSKKIASFNTSSIEDISVIYKDVGPLPENFVNTVLSGKDIEKHYKMWKDRINYLNQELKKIYMTVYNEIPLRDVNPESGMGISIVEKACCDEYLDEYMGFIYYVESKSGNVSFGGMIKEVRELYKLKYLFHQRGTYSRAITDGPVTDSYFPNNLPIYVNPENTNQDLILEKFELYVDEGPFTGTLRAYVGEGKDKRDTKSGKTYDEIINKVYTNEEYERLLNNISLQKQSNLDLYTYQIYDTLDLKTNATNLKDKEIEKLIKSLTTILGKAGNKEFNEKYSDLLYNIGYYQYFMKLSEKEKKNLPKKLSIKNDESLLHIRLHYLKKCYNDYLRKHLAMIKNGKSRIKELETIEDDQLLTFEDNEYISKEVQSFIYNEYEPFEQFYDSSVQIYFKNAKLKYDANTINSIYGEDDIHDSQYKKVLKFSNFSFKDASEIIHYLFIKELNNLILCTNENDDSDEEIDEAAGEENITLNAASMDAQCKYRCMFIQFILDKILDDIQLFDTNTLEIEKIKNAKNYAYLQDLEKALNADEDDIGYFAKQLQYTIYGRVSTNGLPEEGANEEMSDAQIKTQETMDEFVDKAKADYLLKYGTDMPSDLLETAKEEYMDKLYNEELAEHENENVQDGEGEYGGVMVDADFTTDELAFAAEN